MVNRVLLIRHGETTDNVIEVEAPSMTRSAFARFVAGANDAMLTDRGKMQARELRARLRSESVQRLFVSPLQRAIDTAAIAADGLGMPAPIVIEELRELIPRCAARVDDTAQTLIGLRTQLWPAYARMLLAFGSQDRMDRSMRRLRRAWRQITADDVNGEADRSGVSETVGVIGHGWATIVLIRTLQLHPRWRVGRVDLSSCGVTVVERR